MDDYSDIIDLKRPEHINDAFSAKHPKMQREDRAKQFASFAALRGHKERVKENERVTVSKIILSENEAEELGMILQEIDEKLFFKESVAAEITYYVADKEREGEGVYYTVEGNIEKIDTVFYTLKIDNKKIKLDDIYKITLTSK